MYGNNQTVHLEQPVSAVSLATSAMLVNVEINVWAATKSDRSISEEVTASKNADNEAGRFVRNLLAGNPQHKKIANYRQTVYNWLQRITYTWNKTQDLLPVVRLEQFMKEYSQHDANFMGLVDDFCEAYASIVSDMAFKQGDMFNRDDYPPVEEVRAKFGIKLYTSEVPAHDWRCAIAGDIAEDLRQQYEKQTEEIIKSTYTDQISRFSEVLNSISHCCGVEEVEENGEVKTKKRKVYDTTIEKAKQLANEARSFNIAASKELLGVAVALEELLDGVTADRIRDSEAVRANVKDGVDDILSKFGF